MKLFELQQAVRAVEPTAVLVSPRTLDRLIQQVNNVQSVLGEVPHRECFILPKHVLFRYAEQEELGLEPDQLLPPIVILLSRPSAEELNETPPDLLLRTYWRRLFHAGVHRALEDRHAEGKLTDEHVRARIEQLGRVEFDEARTVLEQDNYLVPEADERGVYIEFAAVYLELRWFAPELLPVWFPALRDPERVLSLLAADVDAAALFARLRPAGAAEPAAHAGERADEAHEYYWELSADADAAARAGNLVRAAVLHRRAARVAPATLASGTRAAALADLEQLATRLQAALQLTDAELAEWRKDLPILLDKTDQGKRPPEVALLFDLQQLCQESEQTPYTLDVIEWLLSVGKRPIMRPLPGQRLVRVTRCLRQAAQRLTAARLSDAHRQHLGGLLRAALAKSEERLRARFEPLLVDALQGAGLHPANVPEHVAFRKMIGELLDRISDHGYFTFGELRDTISANRLKLPDLIDPQDFIRGDPLIRLDRRLATVLDGIYRSSEFYMRWLERASALNFGTAAGRWFTRHVTLPFGGAFLLVNLPGVLVKGIPQMPALVYYPLWLLLGCFLLALLHSPALRKRCAHTGKAALASLHTAFVEVPTWLLGRPFLRRLAASWLFQLFLRFLFTPLLVCAALALAWPELFANPPGMVGMFLATAIVFNSRPWRGAEELLRAGVVSFYHMLRAGLLPSLIHWVLQLFKELVEFIEYLQFRVDEWLRFRGGEGRLALATRAVLGLLWFPISYVIHFYMVVLVEPGFNPIKYPISAIAAKFVYAALTPWVTKYLSDLGLGLGDIFLYVFVSVTFFLLPDAFTFLIWEAKENWGLYHANRPSQLKPARVGRHGETVRELLHPSFHSGIVPKLFARLRRAERAARATGSRRAVRQCQDELRQTATALVRFVEREFLALLTHDARWEGHAITVGQVSLATNRIVIELAHGAHPDQPVRMEFEDSAGWLVAGLGAPGWLAQVTAEQQETLRTALAVFYKLAGVHLVREQVQANLPTAVTGYAVAPEGLVLWLDHRQQRGVVCDLGDPEARFRPLNGAEVIAAEWPSPEAHRLVFAQSSLTWEQWVESWEQSQNGHGPPRLAGVSRDIVAR